MPADEHLGLQFEHSTPDLGESYKSHRLQALRGGERVGEMWWSRHGVHNVEVEYDQRRQGIGTAMWNEAHRIAETTRGVPKPRHSTDRTIEGTAWAKAVGGPLPRLRRDLG